MRILMGVPVHEMKAYCEDKWLEAIGNFNHPYVKELFLVDNSPDLTYIEHLMPLIPKHFKASYIHIELPQTDPEERVAMCRVEIVKKMVADNYDWWFSWETDTIAPPDILDKLLPFTNQFPVIHHLTPSRQNPDDDQSNSFGLSLVRRDMLEKFTFDHMWGNIDPLMPNCHHGADSFFNRRVLRAGYPIAEFSGLVRPIQHLDK